jgi:uncharacterized protein (TIGR00255 family)
MVMKRPSPICSMTGFGKGGFSSKSRRILVEIKSVNNRFLDLQIRGPRLSAQAENLISNRVKQFVERGSLTLQINLVDMSGAPARPSLNVNILTSYKKIYDQAAKLLKLQDKPSLPFLLGLPEAIRLVPETEEDNALSKQILAAVDEAVSALNKMRADEGEALARDIEKRIEAIRAQTLRIEKEAPERTAGYKARLEKKMTELLQASPDEALRTRLLTEITLMADKTDTSEETTRLQSHLSQFLAALQAGGAVGKKLNFLQQEIYREANTISSKSPQSSVIEMCIAIKEESEKIREQIQNLE